jgi:hypothetical protein
MQKSVVWLGLLLVSGTTIWGCGSSDSGLENGPGSGGAAGASGGAAGGSSGSAGSAGSANLSCEGTHPEVDGGERRCPEGECRCRDSTDGSDKCLSETTAAECCGDGQLECFREGGKFECTGDHPQVDGGARFCAEGACYCEGRDACLPAEIAAACCPDTPKCD